MKYCMFLLLFQGGIAVLNEQFQKDLLNTTLNVQEAKSKSHCEFTGNVDFTTKFINLTYLT